MSAVEVTRNVPGIASGTIDAMLKRERDRFLQANPTSAKLGAAAKPYWHNGVPMHWMLDWSTPFPLFAKEAKGATLTDVDGHAYDDFCLGDTGSMFGHSPEPVVKAIREQSERGLTYMLSTEDVPLVGQLLSDMFGLPYWQVATTATDANRFVIRWCRAITRRPKVLIMNGCYHGAVEDTFLRLDDGKPANRAGLLGQVYDLTQGTVVVEFNDLEAVERALKAGDVACILTEPALTNIGMVLPQAGYLDGLAALAKKYSTLLVIDETHTISTAEKSPPAVASGRRASGPR